MPTHDAVLQAFQELFSYPAGRVQRLAETCVPLLRRTLPNATRQLEPLATLIDQGAEGELEELFTRTFDNNAERALELGWHLWGESYARGAFLVRMRALLREHTLAESQELPDHLGHVLGVIACARAELAGALTNSVVLPALAKILAGFEGEKNPYGAALHGLRDYLGQSLAKPGGGAAHA